MTISAADSAGLRWDRLRLSGTGLRLRSFANSGPFDVINIHGPAPTISDLALLRLALAKTEAPVVYTHHFSIHFDLPVVDRVAGAYEWMVRKLAGRCAAVVTTTDSYARLFRPQHSDVRSIPWGVEQSRFEAATSSYDGSRPLRVLAIGQFRRYKGMAVAVRAVGGHDGLHLTLGGTGPLVDSVMANVPVEATNVDYVGFIPDDELPDVYRAHDVVLLPSRTQLEAFGIVLLEGMASGCVPVASDLPGVRDVVGTVGLTATPGCPESLRETLLELAAEPGEVRDRSRQAAVVAGAYTWERTVDEYETLFVQVAHRAVTVTVT